MKAVKEASDYLVNVGEEYQCKVCSAHATGFHFEAQSCSACCAFFRRAVSLKRTYKCFKALAGSKANSCKIIYTEQKLCRSCRLKKCLEVGMNKDSVQGPKAVSKKTRSYSTKSGLRRNKRFGLGKDHIKLTEESKKSKEAVLEDVSADLDSSVHNDNSSSSSSDVANFFSQMEKNGKASSFTSAAQPVNSTVHHNIKLDGELPKTCALYPPDNILRIFVEEEMKIAERRRIMFCERPVGSLLGRSKACPFTVHDIKPLRFRDFRKSIRTHILLIYEWLRVWPQYYTLTMEDQITFLRKCVLYHTILDPCFITMQMGDLSKFVLPNGGYVSTVDDEGWQDEKEISRDIKKRLKICKKIYSPLLNRVMEIITQMVNLNLKFEEFVALKALVSFQFTMSDVSKNGRVCMKKELDEVCRSLFGHYFEISDDFDKAQRFGNILMLMSPIFVRLFMDTATNFVESHHQVQFFDLWQLDSLLLQFLKNKT